MWYLIVSIPDLCTLTYFGAISRDFSILYLWVHRSKLEYSSAPEDCLSLANSANPVKLPPKAKLLVYGYMYQVLVYLRDLKFAFHIIASKCVN